MGDSARSAKAAAVNADREIAPDGKLILIEQVVPEGNDPQLSKFADLIMMVMTGGRERTGEQYGKLLERAGFRLARIIPTESPVNLIEAVPA